MRIMTLNVNQFMSTAKQLHDVHRAPDHADAILWQEIADAATQAAVAELDGFATHWPRATGPRGHGFRAGQPISWRTSKWVQLDAGEELLHDGEAGICEDRMVSWVLLRHRISRRRIALVNTHYVPRAWPPSRDDRQAFRREMWLEGNARHRELIGRLVAQGHPVLGGGDFNRQHDRHPAPVGLVVHGRPVNYLTRRGIDYLFAIGSARHRFEVRDTYTATGFESDHQGRVARVRLRRRRVLAS